MSRTKIPELLYFEAARDRELCFMHSLPVTFGHSAYVMEVCWFLSQNICFGVFQQSAECV